MESIEEFVNYQVYLFLNLIHSNRYPGSEDQLKSVSNNPQNVWVYNGIGTLGSDKNWDVSYIYLL